MRFQELSLSSGKRGTFSPEFHDLGHALDEMLLTQLGQHRIEITFPSKRSTVEQACFNLIKDELEVCLEQIKGIMKERVEYNYSYMGIHSYLHVFGANAIDVWNFVMAYVQITQELMLDVIRPRSQPKELAEHDTTI